MSIARGISEHENYEQGQAMSNKKQILVASSALLAVMVLWLGWRYGKTEADGPDRASAEYTGGVMAAVARVQRGTLENSLTISGEFKPFQEIDVHAKVAGYIKRIYVDVGSHVKEGQTIAVLEVPELAAELTGADAAVRRSKEEVLRAKGDVERAKSAHEAAHAMCMRMQQAAQQREGLVAQQEIDDVRAKDLESEAEVSSAEAALNGAQQALEVAEANAKQYAALAAYTRIVAPFTGIITVRYADTGALIAAGTSSSTQSMPVVRLAEEAKLRLVLPIPESLAAQIRLGDPVKVHVQALNQDYVGKVSRFASALDLQTRTMETEIDFENKDGRLLPGMYAETVLQLAQKKDSLLVPLEAIARDQGEARVLVVNGKDTVEERKITLGTQGKRRVEVLSGLNEGDRVVLGNQSQFRKGEKVITKEVTIPAADEEGAN
jgi:RND family efflux transporter MFP subunit